MDTTALERAYRDLLDLARPGGFRPPTDAAGWPAELVLAQVVANDRLLTAVTAALLAGRTPAYDNGVAGSSEYLHAVARAAGDWSGLVATARACGLELVLLARQLDDTQAAAVVATTITDGDVVRVDGPVPWSGVLNTHADVHLPAHRDQLAALR